MWQKDTIVSCGHVARMQHHMRMQRDSLKNRLLARRNPRHKPHKLTRTQVYDILRRFAAGETQVALAAEYGVSHQVVSYHVRKACEE